MMELKNRFQTAIMLITHDLGIVAQTCDRVAVMYSGEIVELGQIKYIFDKGEFHHPYTIGLFNSIPNIKEESARLNPIEGMMPDPTLQIQGCRFADRCAFCTNICKQARPPIVCRNGHMVRCHRYGKEEE